MLQSVHEFAQQVTTEVENALSYTLPRPKNRNRLVLGSLSGRFLQCLQLKETPAKEVYIDALFGLDLRLQSRGESFAAFVDRQVVRRPDYDRAARTCEFYVGLFPEHLTGPRSRLGVSHYLEALSLSYYGLSKTFPVYAEFFQDTEAIIDGFQQVSATFSWREIGPHRYRLN